MTVGLYTGASQLLHDCLELLRRLGILLMPNPLYHLVTHMQQGLTPVLDSMQLKGMSCQPAAVHMFGQDWGISHILHGKSVKWADSMTWVISMLVRKLSDCLAS